MGSIQRNGSNERDCLRASVFSFRAGCAALLCLVGVSAAVAQQTIHVPADQPTIQAGINAASNGDTVLVSPGTYNENIDFKGKGITVTSGAKTYSDAAATIINSVASGPVVNFSTNEAPTAVLNGFTIQGAYARAGIIPAGVFISGTSPTVSNNIIQQNIGCGVVIFYSGANPLIEDNDIRQNRAPQLGEQSLTGTCGGSAGEALAIAEAGTVTVTGNIIEENSTVGPYQGAVSPGIWIILTKKVVMANNIVRNNDFGGLYYNDAGSGTSDTLVMIQNLFYSDKSAPANSTSGLQILGNASPPYTTLIEINNTIYTGGQELLLTFAADSDIENNIFYQPHAGSLALDCLGSAGSIPIRNNDFFRVDGGNPVGDSAGGTSGCPLGSGNLEADPQFIDAANGNFHTQRTSPVVAAGDINAPQIPPMDLDNRARTVCGTIDMGVYEVHPQPATVVTSSNNPSVGGSSVTFTAQVPGNCNIPTGTVTFLDGTNVLGTVALSAGASATLSTSSLTVGTHIITVTYPGDFNFDASTSAPITQVVTGYPTSTTLAVSPNPADAFAPIQLSGTVTSQFGKPTGAIIFAAGGKVLATAPLDGNGNASVTISTLGAGTYNIVATYSSDVNFAASSSLTVIEKVIGADSATSLTASPNPATFGQAVSFRATVRAVQGSVVPTGTVTYSDGGVVLGSAPLDATGAASFNISTLSLGTRTITASYGGSGNFNTSSASVNETITAIPTTLALTASPNPAAFGQPVTIAVIVTNTVSSQIPSGTATFFDGSTMLGMATLGTSGQASLVTSSLALGTHTLTATYPAGTIFGNSVSPPVQETILPSSFTVALSPSTITIHAGQQGTVAIQLASVGLFAGPLTLSYGTLPPYASASLSSSSVVLSQAGTGAASLGINTAAKITASVQPLPGPGLGRLPSAFAATIILLLPFGTARRKRLLRIFGVVLAGVLMQSLVGCTNRYFEVNLVAPGTYQVPITATDNNQNSATSNLSLVVVP